MNRVLIVFGTRPEAIKMAPVVYALQQDDALHTEVCISSQHRELLTPTLDLFGIEPDHDLNIMRPDQSLSQMSARILRGMEQVIEASAPDLLLVHGDTTTGFAAALSGFYHGVPVAHVEAGLRTGDLQSPWPEEFNRKIIGQVAALHFAPTESCRDNLLKEHVDPATVTVTGNTVIDALMHMRDHLRAESEAPATSGKALDIVDPARKLLLVTGHRRENYGQGFIGICAALRDLAEQFRDTVQIIYPVHLNPNVREPVERLLSGIDNLHLIEPVDYAEFVLLMENAYLILTDSGGIQEEAPAFGVPVLVMRDTTERPEAIAAGTAQLVGTDRRAIVARAGELIRDPGAREQMARADSPFGDGTAALQIARAVRSFFTAGS